MKTHHFYWRRLVIVLLVVVTLAWTGTRAQAVTVAELLKRVEVLKLQLFKQQLCAILKKACLPPVVVSAQYPLHRNITAAVFWVGEPEGNGSSEDNALSAWDDDWQENYGGYDDPRNRHGYYPADFVPRQNPFYLDLPYNDFNNNGTRKQNAQKVVPWAGTKTWGSRESMMKNQWVRLVKDDKTCYGQIEDAGPYQYDDHAYVFGTNDARPLNRQANNAGMDVSPALRDCLAFNGWNNVDNQVDWQFVNFVEVPAGPWKGIVTTAQINWP